MMKKNLWWKKKENCDVIAFCMNVVYGRDVDVARAVSVVGGTWRTRLGEGKTPNSTLFKPIVKYYFNFHS